METKNENLPKNIQNTENNELKRFRMNLMTPTIDANRVELILTRDMMDYAHKRVIEHMANETVNIYKLMMQATGVDDTCLDPYGLNDILAFIMNDLTKRVTTTKLEISSIYGVTQIQDEK